MNIPFLSFDARNQIIREEAFSAFQKFFDSKWYVLGEETKKFEEELALYNKTNHAVGVSSGLDALHLSLKALEIGEGDEVIVPSNTYIATVLAITYVGAKPIFVEPRMETFNLNPDCIEKAITPRTKAIMPVHLYGQPCEMDAIMTIAYNYNLYVIEDNAQSIGATYNGKLTGSFGDINAVSFYPTKNLGALGEAGAITTDNNDLADRVRTLRNYGSKKRYYNDFLGYNNRIDEYEAAFLRVSLKYLDSWNNERDIIGKEYRAQLSHIENIKTTLEVDGVKNVNHLFVIRTSRRDELMSFLKDNGIGTIIHYPVPPHLQNCYKNLGYTPGDFPIAEELANTCLSLPLYPGMKSKEVSYISERIAKFFKLG